jgi:DNA-binding transcriptional LysR family regulator
VSRAVAALEQELGRPMLIRTTRQASLSAAGSRVVRLGREALDAVSAIEGIDHDSADLRVGYAWSALGEHTAVIQQRWSARHPGHTLNFVLSSTPTAGLAAGLADLAVIRHRLDDSRFETIVVGTEQRFAVLSPTDPLAVRRQLRHPFADRIVARNSQVGSTGPYLWSTGRQPASFHEVSSVEDYLTVIAAGQAIGITSPPPVNNTNASASSTGASSTPRSSRCTWPGGKATRPRRLRP